VGSTFNGGTGAMNFSLPVTSANDGSEQELICKLYSAGTPNYWAGPGAIAADSTIVQPYFAGSNPAIGVLENSPANPPQSSGYPMQSGSVLAICGTYETT
jgi:hypothetical protein